MTTGPFKGDWGLSTTWRYSSGGAHFAWDVACAMRTELYAIGEGTIVDCADGVHDQPPGRPAGSGAPSNWIILTFTFPAGPYKGQTGHAYYQHLTKGGVKVRAGQKVRKGELIGLSGNSGNTTGPHLHLVVLKPGYTMSRYSRYTYLQNSGMVVWPLYQAWGGTRYGKRPVYVSKFKLGVDDSASVRALRYGLVHRGLLSGWTKAKPGNKYTPKVRDAVKTWQTNHKYRPTGFLTIAQTRRFFQTNKRIEVRK